MSRLSRAAEAALLQATARKRILSNVGRLVMAPRKTLESKISEAGRERVHPKPLGEAMHTMLTAGDLVAEKIRGTEVLSLPDTPATDLDRRRVQLDRLLEIYHRHASGARRNQGVIGAAGELMLKRAFGESATMDYMHWGDAHGYRDAVLDQPSDGLVVIRNPVPGQNIHENVALVEVKNRREWHYPENYMLWKLVRNAYLCDIVGVYLARRIPKTTFWYTFKRAGAIGVETFNQFAPAASEPELGDVKHRDGMGYHDLYFKDTVPPYLQRQIDQLPERITAARARMQAVRPIVSEYLADLADKALAQADRTAIFNELQERLTEFDTPEDEEEEPEDDDLYIDDHPVF
jgi:hypothetical protein